MRNISRQENDRQKENKFEHHKAVKDEIASRIKSIIENVMNKIKEVENKALEGVIIELGEKAFHSVSGKRLF